MSKSLTSHLLLLLLIFPISLHAAEPSDLPPMTWQILEFERKSAWGNARSRLQLSSHEAAAFSDVLQQPTERDYRQPDPTDHIQELQVEATVGSKNSVSLQLLMQPESQALYQRSRFSIGRKDRRLKFYRYAQDGFTRIRKDPADKREAALPHEQWSRSSSAELSYQGLEADAVVTSPFALFVILSRLTPEQLAEQPRFLVNTDHNVYEVTLSPQPAEELQVNYTMIRSDQPRQRLKETIAVIPVKLMVAPTSLANDKPDFEVMGLTGEVTVYIDTLDHTPLRVAGIAPRVGAAHLDLANAVLVARESATP